MNNKEAFDNLLQNLRQKKNKILSKGILESPLTGDWEAFKVK